MTDDDIDVNLALHSVFSTFICSNMATHEDSTDSHPFLKSDMISKHNSYHITETAQSDSSS
jgi:hypothetical protein